jgi:hypothetical protein
VDRINLSVPVSECFFRSFQVEEEHCIVKTAVRDYQPLMPVRGTIFTLQQGQSPEQKWPEIITNHSLWGNNVLGTDFKLDTDQIFNQIQSYDLKTCAHITYPNKQILPDTDFLWISLSDKAIQQKFDFSTFFDYTKAISTEIKETTEIWLGVESISDDELTELIDNLHLDPQPHLKALICDPETANYEMIRREMPLTMMFLTVNRSTYGIELCETEENRNMKFLFPNQITQQFFHVAPLSYGTVIRSSCEFDEINRFIWSLLSWQPQPTIEEILELYGNWFFGHSAASDVRDIFLYMQKDQPPKENERDFEQIHTLIQRLRAKVPAQMRSLAEPRLSDIEKMLL